MRRLLCGGWLPALLLMCGSPFATLGPGDTQPNFTLDEHGTSQQVNLCNDLSGKILVFDFFAEWCEYCNLASSELEPDIQQYYAALGGNPAHLPVQLVSINIDATAADATATNNYISEHGLQFVLDDPSSAVYDQYSAGGIPQFAIVDAAANTNSPQWQVLWTQTGYDSGDYTSFRSVIDSVTALMAGDANGDGKVDIQDLTIVLTYYGRTGMTWSQGDFQGDGRVDINDLTIVLANFGKGVASSAAMAPVPEPGTLALLSAVLVGLLAYAWRKR